MIGLGETASETLLYNEHERYTALYQLLLWLLVLESDRLLLLSGSLSVRRGRQKDFRQRQCLFMHLLLRAANGEAHVPQSVRRYDWILPPQNSREFHRCVAIRGLSGGSHVALSGLSLALYAFDYEIV